MDTSRRAQIINREGIIFRTAFVKFFSHTVHNIEIHKLTWDPWLKDSRYIIIRVNMIEVKISYQCMEGQSAVTESLITLVELKLPLVRILSHLNSYSIQF